MENRHAELTKLLNRYLGGFSTKEDRKKLYELIASGDFDEQIGDDILSSLKNEAGDPGSFSENARLEKLYQEKIRGQIRPGLSHIPAGRTRNPAVRWLTAASLSGLILAAGLWFFNSGAPKTPDQLIADTPPPALVPKDPVMRFADKQLVRLPDGSSVLLNDGAELTYDPEHFGHGSREVGLSGEAFFDITPDPGKIFVVRSGAVRTTVLGTAFNVKSIPGRNEVQVTVARGKVSVGSDSRTYDLLTADQQLTVNTVTNAYLKKELKSDIATEWKNDFLILDDVAMETAAGALKEKFGVTVHFKNEKLKNCHITASFLNGENLDHVLQVICTIHDLSYSYQGDRSEVILEGDNPCD